jgi:Protein of unknown function (DUF2934)
MLARRRNGRQSSKEHSERTSAKEAISMSNRHVTAAQETYPSVPEHCIRERAYEIYVRRGRKGGHADSDWLTAEAELKELKKKADDLVVAVEALTV